MTLPYLIIGCAVLGLLVGSFLNVVIYRVPRGESVIRPRSHCPKCSHVIRERDNIPVISWLLLRGKCRDCSSPISSRYALVEIASGALFAGAAARMGFSGQLPAFLILLAGLMALSTIDLENQTLPKAIVYPLLGAVGFALLVDGLVTHQIDRVATAIIVSVVWFVVFYLVNFLSPRYLGFGDVRLSLVLGIALGWLGWKYALLGLYSGALEGLFVGGALMAAKKWQRDKPLAFGPFLACGAAIAIFAGPELVPLLSRI